MKCDLNPDMQQGQYVIRQFLCESLTALRTGMVKNNRCAFNNIGTDPPDTDRHGRYIRAFEALSRLSEAKRKIEKFSIACTAKMER